ncbi:hypothetical protein AM588_10009823 [Phytophthora nicotianae]|uniref:Uncharacterized protein n=1 Tax=Phytophthora nicotianae TaxID=4792 RepID=A0A0W8DE29_PHYNI|nr:hypothetical protein AM588_10009823 [Phytophthora nicotianae]
MQHQPSREMCHLQFTMPIELWDAHLVPFLTLNEAVALAELSHFFYDVVHEHVQLRTEASLVCSVPELLRVLSKWRNLRDVAFQPVADPESERLHENIHYNVNAAGGIIVDHERNQPAPEPEPLQANESYTDEDGVSVPMRYTCPGVLQDCIRSSDAQVKRLNLSGIARLEDIDVLTASANSLSRVNLSGCSRISDIRFLAGAQEVDLRFCDALEDVRPLAASARIVKLAGCSKLMDVSPLARVRELDLSYCNNIEDVSALDSVHTLSLRHCPNVIDVSALSKVHTLNLSGCTQLEDVSALKNVHELNLSDCEKVKDVSMLTGVRVLDLRYNKNNSEKLKAGVAKLRGRVPIIRM